MTMLQVLETLPPFAAATALLGATAIIVSIATWGARAFHRRTRSPEMDALLAAAQEHRNAAQAARAEMAAEAREVRAELERVKAWASVRTGVVSHQDAICKALQDLGGIADTVGRLEWIESNSLVDTERAAYSTLRGIKIHVRALAALNRYQDEHVETVFRAIENVWIQWGELTYELVRRGDAFRRTHPEEREFSESNYFQLWLNLYGSVGELEAALLQLPAPEVTHQSSPRYLYASTAGSSEGTTAIAGRGSS